MKVVVHWLDSADESIFDKVTGVVLNERSRTISLSGEEVDRVVNVATMRFLTIVKQ